ncbi:MAG: hypothetical protein J6B79_01740 [Clostridia bacterium]|nr:hypothetical protein [Clostridia bacterium]
MILATVIMTAGVSTWIIFGEISAGPNFLATTKKTPKINGGGVYYLNEEYKRFDTAENRAYDGGTVILEAGFLSVTDDEGNTVSGRFVFADNGVNTKQIEFTDCDVSELHTKKAETSTLLADKFQAFPSTVLLRFIPTDTTNYFSVEYTANVLSDVRDSDDAVVVPIYPVARIGTTFYGTVEKALTSVKANETVYVLPGANPTIKTDCAVPSNTTLTLHIDDNDGTYGAESGQTERNYSHRTKVMDKAEDMVGYTYSDLRSGATAKTSFDSFSDVANANNIYVNLKNQLTIGEGVTLAIETGGTLNVGAIVGNTSSGMTGHTSGYYTQILMDNNAKIVSNGTVDCLGYIKEINPNNGSQITLTSGNLYAPFVIYDYNSARSTIAVAMNRYHKIYPFNVFDMPNVQSKIVCNNTASIYGYADIFSNEVDLSAAQNIAGGLGGTMLRLMGIDGDKIPAQHNLITLKVVGKQDSIINSNGRVELKYNIDKTLYNSKAAGMYNTGSTIDMDCYEGGSLGQLSLSIKVLAFDVSMSTSNYFFPVCWKYNINLRSGSFSIPHKTKFLSGSTVTVNKGVILNTSADVIFYPKSTRTESENTADNANVFFDPTISSGSPYPARDMAKMIVNGEATINGGFGGYVQPGQKDAVLAINASTLSITEWEGNGMIETMSEKDDSQKDGTLISVASPYMSSIVSGLKLLGYVVDGEGGYFLTTDGKARVPNGSETEYVTQSAKGDVNTKGNIINLGNKKYTSNGSAWEAEVAMRTITANYNTNQVNTPTIIDGDGNSYSIGATVADGTILTITVTAKNRYKITALSVGADVDNDGNSEWSVTHTVDGNVVITVESESTGSCIAAGTLITLADGTQKAVENVTADDVLLVFNHFTGEYEPAHILFLERGEYGYYNVINLEFSDGTATKLIFEHALFDLTLNKYVYVTEQNYSEFVGHEFALSAESGYKRVTLIKASLDEEYTAPYSITTVYHFNYFIDGLFSLPGAIDGLFNYFEYADNLQYDEEKMLADIEKYGLYTYEDFAEHFSYEIFECCIPVKYLKVAVGKSMITYEELIELFNKYASDLIT